MSSRRTYPLQLSTKTEQDFVDILRYSGKTWGEARPLAYHDKINAALETLRSNPRLGHRRSDLPATQQAYLVGSHIIVCWMRGDAMAVPRILHQPMSLAKHLRPNVSRHKPSTGAHSDERDRPGCAGGPRASDLTRFAAEVELLPQAG